MQLSKNRHIVKQVELLEHHSYLGTETVDRLCILLSMDKAMIYLTARRCLQMIDAS